MRIIKKITNGVTTEILSVPSPVIAPVVEVVVEPVVEVVVEQSTPPVPSTKIDDAIIRGGPTVAITEKVVGGVKVIEHVEEFEIASDALKAERLNICRGCSYRAVISNPELKITSESCSQCSCLLVTRTAYQESFCPKGKW